MKWLNEPAQWSAEGNTITVTADAKTDFWRLTHSGEVNDNGHLYAETVPGDFVATVKFNGEYGVLYDQAGLMVRVDEAHWMKCGIELFEGVLHVSTVITREYSDWSMRPLPEASAGLRLRVSRHGNTLEAAYSLDGENYLMMRQGYFPPEVAADVGVMCCAPVGDGFTTIFEDFTINPA